MSLWWTEMHRLNPSLIIGCGVCADQISQQTEEMILKRCKWDVLPPIFRFINLTGDSQSSVEEVSKAYASVLSKRAKAESEFILRNREGEDRSSLFLIDPSGVEVYFILPLQSNCLRDVINLSKQIDVLAGKMISVSKTALLLIPKQLLALQATTLQTALQELDFWMKSSDWFPFNRCFFIDEINEAGHTIDTIDELIELVSSFLALALASEFAIVLRDSPPPFYQGEGSHYNAYASFSCNRIVSDLDHFIGLLSERLVADITHQLFKKKSTKYQKSDLWQKGSRWFEESLQHIPESYENASFHNISTDPDYHAARTRLTDWHKKIFESFDFNLTIFRDLAEACLENGLIALENLKEQQTQIKSSISELLIKILLGYEDKPPAKDPLTREKRASLGPFIICCLFGVAAIAGPLLAGRPAEEGVSGFNLGSVLVGIVLLVLAPILFPRKKIEIITPVSLPPTPYEEMLREKRTEHQKQTKILSIHKALFTDLDKACINVDLTYQEFEANGNGKLKSGFSFDLLDSDLANSFYEKKYGKQKHLDINRIKSPGVADALLEALHSYPTARLSDFLREYGKQCFDYVKGYSLQQICDIRRTLKSKDDFLSPPFWSPLPDVIADRLVFVSISEVDEPELRDFIADICWPRTVIFLENFNQSEIVLIQISHLFKAQRLSDLNLTGSSQDDDLQQFPFTEDDSQSWPRTDRKKPERANIPPSASSTNDSAEIEITRTITRQIQKDIIEDIKELFVGPVLQNYHGHICVALVRDGATESLEAEAPVPILIPGQVCALQVWLQSQPTGGGMTKSVEIQDGVDAKTVEFELTMDSDSLEFEPQMQRVQVETGKPSERVNFQFVVPHSSKEHDLWVKLSQKNRLVQILHIALKVRTE